MSLQYSIKVESLLLNFDDFDCEYPTVYIVGTLLGEHEIRITFPRLQTRYEQIANTIRDSDEFDGDLIALPFQTVTILFDELRGKRILS